MWEDEFAQFLDEFRRDQGPKSLLTSLETLFQKCKIGPREKGEAEASEPRGPRGGLLHVPEQNRRQGNGLGSVESSSLPWDGRLVLPLGRIKRKSQAARSEISPPLDVRTDVAL